MEGEGGSLCALEAAAKSQCVFRAEMIRGSGPDTFIRVLHRDGVQAQRADE